MRPFGAHARAVLRAGVCALVVLAACGAPAATAPAAPAPLPDTGVTLAGNVGPTLIVLSLDPGEAGPNTVTVDVRGATGTTVAGTVRVDAALDGTTTPIALAAGGRRGTLALTHPGRAELRVAVTDGPSAGATLAFAVDLPAERVPAPTLAGIDQAMRGLHSLREVQTLTGGGPVLLFHFDYLSPDRVRYVWTGASGQPQETRIIGRDRFDREGSAPWTHADLGLAERVPQSDYARGATRVRTIGHEGDLTEIAFVQQPDVYYRVWVGPDRLVRRYTMMTKGHYMTGAYSDFDAPIAISAP